MSDLSFAPPAPADASNELSEADQKALDLKNAIAERAEQAGSSPPHPPSSPCSHAARSTPVRMEADAPGLDCHDPCAVRQQGTGPRCGDQEEVAQGRIEGEGAHPRGRAVQGGEGGRLDMDPWCAALLAHPEPELMTVRGYRRLERDLAVAREGQPADLVAAHRHKRS